MSGTISGTLRRVVRKALSGGRSALAPFSRAKIPVEGLGNLREEQIRRAETFRELAHRRGYRDFEDYYWYHTVDLGDGLVTPGSYDYRGKLAPFHFPDDMRGMNVLDIGSATGFFAFEFERRGAEVTSVELPSLADWDRFPGETTEQTIEKMVRHMPSHSTYNPEQISRLFGANRDAERLYHVLLDGPFRFCREALGSRVKRCYSSAYDLTGEKLGRDGFDLVFMSDILLHTIYPLKVLAAVAPLCRKTLIIAQDMPEIADSRPAVLYVGGDKAGEDNAQWWWPNLACLKQLLMKFGFGNVEAVGKNAGVLSPGGSRFDRTIVHATR